MSQLETAIRVTILNLDGVVYEGDAKALTSYNESGKFDVLPYHAPFISIISQEVIVHEIQGGIKTIVVEKGVMEVEDNVITVFLGIESVN
jgi:F-type H+-transporting ATPase subunit epsilon